MSEIPTYPDETIAGEEVQRMRLMLGAIKAWCSRNGHTYAEKLAMHGLGESVSPPEPPAAPVG